MATKTKIKTDVEFEAEVRGAVKAWAKAEDSAVWTLIHACYDTLKGVIDKDTRKTKLGYVKTWLINAIETEFGEGASKANKRGAHISKILAIADGATDDDFQRWKKEGIGFYKAYSEFSTPQRNPASGKTNGNGNGGEEKPTSWTPPEQGTEAAIADQDKRAEDPDWNVKKGGVTPAVKEAAEKKKAEAAKDPTSNWATQIEQSSTEPSMWVNLLNALDKGLTPDRVMQCLRLGTRTVVGLRGVVEQIMQDERLSNAILDFIKDNPSMFDEGAPTEIEEQEESTIKV
jgi:hypothetical protein